MVVVHFDLFCLLFWVLVYIFINVTSFLRNERFYIFDGEKLCPYLEKIKFVCKSMHFERDDAENVATRRYIKTNEFYLYESDKGICHCGVHGYNLQQSFKSASTTAVTIS